MTGAEESFAPTAALEQIAQQYPALRLQSDSAARDAVSAILGLRISGDLLESLWPRLAEAVERIEFSPRLWQNLASFFAASRSPHGLAGMLERDPESLERLLGIFATSAYLADLLVADPDAFEMVRLTEGRPVERGVLIDEVMADIDQATDAAHAMALLRQFKRRETVRIAFGDFVKSLPFELVVQQISWVADAVVHGAVHFAHRDTAARRKGKNSDFQAPPMLCILALGKLGGTELNYSSDIDLVLLFDDLESASPEVLHGQAEFQDAVAKKVVSLLTQKTELGQAYRVDLRLRPHGRSGPLVIGARAALRYYDLQGRTWERQAFIKARPIAGNIALGDTFLRQLEVWIYRPFLSRADIAGITTIKRKLDRKHREKGSETSNIKGGYGGIRDIEYTTQFLQLLNGHDEPRLRSSNTLNALAALESVGSLTNQERSLLTDNYVFLRRVEHRLQIANDTQTHELPAGQGELKRLAAQLGFRNNGDADTASFSKELDGRRDVNRRILDHLLHHAFPDDSEGVSESDFVLDPDPDLEAVYATLRDRGFKAPARAYDNLMELATESIPFLSARRCRVFLSAVAPALLAEIGGTPNPDQTLTNLCRVADSLGGKAVLWELLNAVPSTLRMFVRLCAASPYLSEILTGSPGMIDDLLDALVLDRPPRFAELQSTARALCQGAEDIDPILHSFKRAAHLQIGILDILGKDSIQETHRCLSDTAEVCLGETIDFELEYLFWKYGRPVMPDGSPCDLVLLALGKLGGREPNYHSDLDVVFLYLADGQTKPVSGGRRDNPTTSAHFYNQLAQRVTKRIAGVGPYGRLYELDTRLRPSGRAGVLAMSLDQFREHIQSSRVETWELSALCKSRPVYGHHHAAEKVVGVVHQTLQSYRWTSDDTDKLRQLRMSLETSASRANIKRGKGGTVDVEFLVQALQLKHAGEVTEILQPNTLTALRQLADHGYLDRRDAETLSDNYSLLRRLESGLRLMNTTARHDLPEDDLQLRQLAYLLDWNESQSIVDACRAARAANRDLFNRIVC